MNIILTLLEDILPSSMSKSARNFVITLIRALLVVMSVNLMELSRAIATTDKTLSAMRRIQRLLSLKLFSCTAVGLAIVSALPIGRKYILTMDRTLWKLGKRVYNILAIGICYDGISIPIYFTAYDKDGTSDFTEQIAFIEHVLDIISADKIECLVADREFGNGNFIRWLGIRKIPFCLRLRENFYVRKAGETHGRKLKTIFSSLPMGQGIVLASAYVVRKNVKVRIYAVRRNGRDGEETLLILASPVGSDFTDKMYRLRWQIEVTFRGLKTAGFNIEETHLSTAGHFQNMLMLIFITYAAAYIDGLLRAKLHSIPIMKSNGRHRFSIFSFGLDVVVSDIIRNVNFIPGICP